MKLNIKKMLATILVIVLISGMLGIMVYAKDGQVNNVSSVGGWFQEQFYNIVQNIQRLIEKLTSSSNKISFPLSASFLDWFRKLYVNIFK